MKDYDSRHTFVGSEEIRRKSLAQMSNDDIKLGETAAGRIMSRRACKELGSYSKTPFVHNL